MLDLTQTDLSVTRIEVHVERLIKERDQLRTQLSQAREAMNTIEWVTGYDDEPEDGEPLILNAANGHKSKFEKALRSIDEVIGK